MFLILQHEQFQHICLGNSDELHANETVVNVNGQKHYLWICIDSEIRLITSWNLSCSRGSDAAFSLFKQPRNLVVQILL